MANYIQEGEMARINIEDSLFKDNAFIDLAIKLGSRRMALGALIEAFMLAQEFYLKTETSRLIPKDEWKRQRIAPEIIEVGFAEEREMGIYVKGSDEQFGWLIQRSEAGKMPKKKKAKSVKRPITTDNDRSSFDNGSNPLTLSLSLSPSLIPTQPLAQDISDEAKASSAPKVTVDPIADDYLARVNPRVKDSWSRTYPDPYWIKTELIKASAWILNNPAKAPKSNYGKFFSNWLSSGWENYRKTIPSKNKNNNYAQEMFDQNPYAEKEAVNS